MPKERTYSTTIPTNNKMNMIVPQNIITLKYYYRNEIHKTNSFPPNLKSMKEEILSLFVHKLPSPFLIQYEDVDGEKISISTEQEYQILLGQSSLAFSFLKLHVVALEGQCSLHHKDPLSLRSSTNGSFEVIDDEGLKKVGIKDLSSPIKTDNQEVQVQAQAQVLSISAEDIECSNSEETEWPPKSKASSQSGDGIEEISLSAPEEEEDKRSCKSAKVPEKSFQTEMKERLNVSDSSFKGAVADLENKWGMKRISVLDFLEKTEQEDSVSSKESPRSRIESLPQLKRANSTPKPSKYSLKSGSESPDDEEEEEDEEVEETSRDGSQEHWVSFTSDKGGANNNHQAHEIKGMGVDGKGLFMSFRKGLQGGRCSSRLYTDSNSDSKDKEESLSLSIRSRRRRSEPTSPKENEKLISLLNDEEVEERKGRVTGRVKGEWAGGQGFTRPFLGESFRSDDLEVRDLSEPSYPQYYFKTTCQNNNNNKKAEIEDLMNGRQAPIGFMEDLSYNEASEREGGYCPPKLLQESLCFSLGDKPWDERNTYRPPPQLLVNEGVFCMRCWESPVIGPVYVCLVCDCIEYCERCAPLTNHNHPLVKMEKKKAAPSPIVPKIQITEAIQEQKKVEKKPHEGSFCMHCWENPIRGPMYTCSVCRFAEYCEKCYPTIEHCHGLTRIEEPDIAQNPFGWKFPVQQSPLLSDLGSDIEDPDQIAQNPFDFKFPVQQSAPLSEIEEDIENPDNIDNGNNSLGLQSMEEPMNESLDFRYYRPEMSDNFAFEYHELSSTPLSIKSNHKEWCLIYKTICLNNVGKAEWVRCHLEPIGEVMGTMTEVSKVAPGNSILLTLEIHGFFAPGKYTSRWRVVHQGEMDVISEMGCLELDFEILKNTEQPLFDYL